ncbi:MAG: MMPL family transporter [Proteobacteria bacterium]|nr:MMPL family transporter [Pseudomonadota bacterium]
MSAVRIEEPRNAIERLAARLARGLIARRAAFAVVFALVSIGLGVAALGVKFDPGFIKQIPVAHEFMKAFLQHGTRFSGANRILVNVRWKGEGDIYNKEYMDVLREVTDEVFFTAGVDRARVFSLFTPNVRYIEVTEQGFAGEVVIPSQFSGDAESPARVRSNVVRSGEIGRLVANDMKGSLVRADLLEVDPSTGEKLNYSQLSKKLEEIRTRFSNDDIEINLIGFAKVTGDVIDGLLTVVTFFAIAFAITAVLLWLYSRSLNLTIVALLVAMLPVLWLLGILRLLGMGMDPMSILVPFLVFAIGVSHAVQMTHTWQMDVQAGMNAREAAEAAFRKMAIPGTIALLTNAVGFGVIMFIEIPIVYELGIIACLGLLLMVITNKMILPIVLSHLPLERTAGGVPPTDGRHRLWWTVAGACEKPAAGWILLGAVVLLIAGGLQARSLVTGDVGSGAPELRSNSIYNIDNDRIISTYSIGMDVLSIYGETKGFDDACLDWGVMNALERLDNFTRGVDGVQSVTTVATIAKVAAGGNNEANPRWAGLQRPEAALRTGTRAADPDLGLNDESCRTLHIVVYLRDHKGSTLHHVVSQVRDYIEANPAEHVTFRLAGGNAGVAAATNAAVEHAEVQMLLSLYVVIALMVHLSFRSWKATLCVMVPLMLVSVLCNALMPLLGIGLKVSTLPVITLGVGVGVDYGIYLCDVVMHELRARGCTLREAIYEAMLQRGTAVVFTGLTMAFGVGTWVFAPLKFQADMGVLLVFMFLVNVVGAMLLLPALAYWLDLGSVAQTRATRPQPRTTPA